MHLWRWGHHFKNACTDYTTYGWGLTRFTPKSVFYCCILYGRHDSICKVDLKDAQSVSSRGGAYNLHSSQLILLETVRISVVCLGDPIGLYIHGLNYPTSRSYLVRVSRSLVPVLRHRWGNLPGGLQELRLQAEPYQPRHRFHFFVLVLIHERFLRPSIIRHACSTPGAGDAGGKLLVRDEQEQ